MGGGALAWGDPGPASGIFPPTAFPTGEHLLDPEAYPLDLHGANPHGEWVTKQSPP